MGTRPTSDRLRETLFNVLTSGNPKALEGSVWLDLFAGTGAVGIEALSRGARSVYFVDNSRRAANVIRENLKSLGAGEGAEIFQRTADQALRELEAAFDYIFLDPPYKQEDAYGECLHLIGHSRLLKPTAIAIAEHDKRFDPENNYGFLKRHRTLKQGDSVLSFYQLS
jgi:16S rRNA (guanine(966)-N(2))-methyltransferase RsmD